MKSEQSEFDESHILHKLKHYLPSQAPLKDFIHHNTLHAFQNESFFNGLHQASELFGYKVFLQLGEYRELFSKGKIDKQILDTLINKEFGSDNSLLWNYNLIEKKYDTSLSSRIGSLRAHWKMDYNFSLDKVVHPILFRIIGSYLDQGISIWNFPVSDKGLISSIRDLEKNSFYGIFKSKRVKQLLLHSHLTISHLLEILIGDESLYEHYLFDQQFAHPGWSGMVSVLEENPNSLFDKKKITLQDFILLELLLELEFIDNKLGEQFIPLGKKLTQFSNELFKPIQKSELQKVFEIWQIAYEWSYYNQVLNGIDQGYKKEKYNENNSFQAVFCIDDRCCSLRRYLEQYDANCSTFGAPGFFNVEFYFQPEHSKFFTKSCPAPLQPQFLIQEKSKKKISKSTFTSETGILRWLDKQFKSSVSSLSMVPNIFFPRESRAMVSSFQHMKRDAKLSIENKNLEDRVHGLQVGFTIPQMTDRVEGLLKSIGLVEKFAPLIYFVGHGASSVNNTHYAGYDCGACSGRPGSVNAKVIAFMANHPEVRMQLKERNICIPDNTHFVGALHDTTRDEIVFYDEELIDASIIQSHEKNKIIFNKSLDDNSKERARRFVLTDSGGTSEDAHQKVKARSISLFEPRPELNHATNALCVVGGRELTKNIFLDRRAFLNSYDYKIDPDGELLSKMLRALAPVCGGINLEYYFSRVDNYKLGAGTKLPHNVMGLIGVANGMDGDLRTGLPSQMIEVHDPIRLLFIVEQFPEIVLNAIKIEDSTYEWFKNYWLHLVVIHPETKTFYRFVNGTFEMYHLPDMNIEGIHDKKELITSDEDNLPVFILNK